jgi:hypothetical protein
MAEHDCKIEYQYFYTTKNWTTPEGEHKTQKEPRITVCYIRTTDCTAVGIAICGPRDNPCRKTGKKIARQRAQHALGLATESEESTKLMTTYVLTKSEGVSIVYGSDMKHPRALGGAKVACIPVNDFRLERLSA